MTELTPDTTTPTASTTTPAAEPGRLPTPTLVLAGGGLLLVIGSLLPWVKVGGIFSISGVSTDWGIITLVAGIVALLAAFGSGKLFTRERAKPVAIAAVLLGLVSLGVALYVGFAIRDSIADDESGSSSETSSTGDASLDASLEDFGNSLAEAFTPTTGIGVYLTALGGLAVAGAGAQAARSRT